MNFENVKGQSIVVGRYDLDESPELAGLNCRVSTRVLTNANCFPGPGVGSTSFKEYINETKNYYTLCKRKAAYTRVNNQNASSQNGDLKLKLFQTLPNSSA